MVSDHCTAVTLPPKHLFLFSMNSTQLKTCFIILMWVGNALQVASALNFSRGPVTFLKTRHKSQSFYFKGKHVGCFENSSKCPLLESDAYRFCTWQVKLLSPQKPQYFTGHTSADMFLRRNVRWSRPYIGHAHRNAADGHRRCSSLDLHKRCRQHVISWV